jgi:hypothetical protein
MSSPIVTPDRIAQIGKAFRASKVLFSAVELGVFRILTNGPRKLDLLTTDVGIAERGARDFFDALVALRLLERDDTGCYHNSAEADHFLDPEKPTYIGGELDHFNKRGYPLWHHLTDALRSGKPQSMASAGNYFLDLYSDAAALETYTEGMTGGARLVAPAIVAKFPWHRYGTVFDIGTSQGGLPVEIARAHAHLTGGGFPSPPALRALRREAGLLPPPELSCGGFFAPPTPDGGRADYWARAA